MCHLADKDNETFWQFHSQVISWYQNYDTTSEITYHPDPSIKWFLGGKLNACYNCIDRHVELG